MNWIKVTEKLPKPFEVVWIYWRDRQVLLGCRTYEDEEAIKCDPSEGWYSFEDGKCRWTRHWMSVHDSLDPPDAPKE
jgi:hypothetical protein